MKNAFGKLFQKITGFSVEDCDSLDDINDKVASKYKKVLDIKKYDSSVVPSRGNIFTYSKKYKDIDNKIDYYLSR